MVRHCWANHSPVKDVAEVRWREGELGMGEEKAGVSFSPPLSSYMYVCIL